MMVSSFLRMNNASKLTSLGSLGGGFLAFGAGCGLALHAGSGVSVFGF